MCGPEPIQQCSDCGPGYVLVFNSALKSTSCTCEWGRELGLPGRSGSPEARKKCRSFVMFLVFLLLSELLGPPGAIFEASCEERCQKHEKPQKCHPHLETNFDNFRIFPGFIFECILRCPNFPHCGRFRDQGLPKRKVVGDHFGDFLDVGPHSEN